MRDCSSILCWSNYILAVMSLRIHLYTHQADVRTPGQANAMARPFCARVVKTGIKCARFRDRKCHDRVRRTDGVAPESIPTADIRPLWPSEFFHLVQTPMPLSTSISARASKINTVTSLPSKTSPATKSFDLLRSLKTTKRGDTQGKVRRLSVQDLAQSCRTNGCE